MRDSRFKHTLGKTARILAVSSFVLAAVVLHPSYQTVQTNQDFQARLLHDTIFNLHKRIFTVRNPLLLQILMQRVKITRLA